MIIRKNAVEDTLVNLNFVSDIVMKFAIRREIFAKPEKVFWVYDSVSHHFVQHRNHFVKWGSIY
ncbi:hypothetical protein N9F50_01850 [Akkermansiaceae bacterium]|nr:hypothetical protein [Akkermansiaceae bacterium]